MKLTIPLQFQLNWLFKYNGNFYNFISTRFNVEHAIEEWSCIEKNM